MNNIVISPFRDSEDKLYVYRLGQTYPREGYIPSDKRIKELSGKENKAGHALIKISQEQSAIETIDLSGNVETVKGLINESFGKEELETLLKAEQRGRNRKGVTEHIENLLEEVK